MFHKVLCKDCLDYMENTSKKFDLVITSPPYNMTSRKGGISDSGRYDVYVDWKTEKEYLKFTKKCFKGFDSILKKNRIVLYNFSYSIENPSLPYKLVSYIEKKTCWRLVDTIIWRKPNGLPFPANKRRLSRNWEYIFVFARKDELETFKCFKGISKKSKGGQKYYNLFYNYIEADNNDVETPELNQATFSSQLVAKLLRIYAKKKYLVYDPFNGTGTTGVACKRFGCSYIGSEISKAQVKYSKERLENTFNHIF